MRTVPGRVVPAAVEARLAARPSTVSVLVAAAGTASPAAFWATMEPA